MWVVLRAIKVIFVTIKMLPNQVSADGESSGGLKGFKPPVKFPIIVIIIIIILLNQSKNFCSEAVHYSKLEIILHHKYPRTDNNYVHIFSENRQGE